MADIARMRELDPPQVRELLGDGSLGGLYERPDEDVLRVWQAGVEEVRDLIANGWSR
jgi:creatinine amidohydrolase